MSQPDPGPELRPEPTARRTDRLATASLAYLVFPYLIFAFGWLRTGVAECFAAVVAVATVLALRRRAAAPGEPSAGSGWRVPLTAAVVAVVWASLSGAGGVGFQNGDYSKHNALLKDLATNHWPVVYPASPADGAGLVPTAPRWPGGGFLSYSLGYYLPAGWAGKKIGWEAAHWALFAWTLVGAYLSLLWFARLLPRAPLVGVLVFPLLGGMCFIGMELVGAAKFWDLPLSAVEKSWLCEWWGVFGSYQSHATQLFWVPQHGLPGWLLAAMVFHEAEVRRSSRNLGFLLALSALWSPFVTIGLAPFVLFGAVRSRFSGALSVQNLVAAPLVLVVVGLFYSGHEKIDHGFVWKIPHQYHMGARILLFWVLEFLACAVLAGLAVADRRSPILPWLAAVTAVLLVIPLYKYGMYNDLTMRGSIPGLTLLWLLSLRALFEPTGRAIRFHVRADRSVQVRLHLAATAGLRPLVAKGLLAVVLGIGVLWGLTNNNHARARFMTSTPPLAQTATLQTFDGGIYSRQYLVARDSRFFRLVGKPEKVQPGRPVVAQGAGR